MGSIKCVIVGAPANKPGNANAHEALHSSLPRSTNPRWLNAGRNFPDRRMKPRRWSYLRRDREPMGGAGAQARRGLGS